MAHPHETLLGTAYQLFAKGDVPGFSALCTPDITFTVPGDGLLSGHLTRDEFLQHLGPAMGAVAGTFREEMVHVAISEEGGAVFVRQEARRDGATHNWNAVHWWRITGGKLASFHEFIDDPAAFQRAWHR